MNTGIYESLITLQLKEKIAQLDPQRYYVADGKYLDAGEAVHYLSQHLAKAIQTAFNLIAEKDKNLQVQKQIEVANKLLTYLMQQIESYHVQEDLIATEGKILQGVVDKLNTDYTDISTYLKEITPLSRLTQSELFTGGNVGLSLDGELKKEIRSSDKIDLLVSFIKWKAIVILRDALQEFTQKGGHLRVITTTYMGATDARALEELIKLKNTTVKVSYNNANERLHAKAYLFYRKTGFHTGYIGSSNFSRSALTDGLEWNVKITTAEIPHIIDKFQKTFESYWNNDEFEAFNEGKIEKLNQALKQNNTIKQLEQIAYFFDLHPYHYQKEILEKLHVERSVHHSFKNLVVAATGTGKTMVAAFDFKSYLITNPGARLLFVAHRIEIITEALHTFRNVLKDQNFGTLLGNGENPFNKTNVFATIQSLTSSDLAQYASNDYYDYIIVDEVHHSKASTYQRVMKYFTPKILLGLTATPERMDGVSILPDFNHRIAAEIRLPDALNKGLLCPFQYFGITDQLDYSHVSWKSGHYDTQELTNLYTGNDLRVVSILQNIRTYCKDIDNVSALGFCISIEHAKYMQQKFERAGLKSAYLVSENSHHRKEIIHEFKTRKINYLFVVDIFNEGIDIPQIDTLLFLRPTESLTIFLQQLGRGLRLNEGKNILTVLDFVGQARDEYDFENKFRGLIGKTQTPILKEIEMDFPHLPLGCAIILERKAKEYILENIRKATQLSKRALIRKIQNYSSITDLPLTLENFLKVYNLSLKQVYQNYLFSELKAMAFGEILEQTNLRRVKTILCSKWLVTDALHYFRFIQALLAVDCDLDQLEKTAENKSLGLILYYDFYSQPPINNLTKGIMAINENKNLLPEIKEYVKIKIDQITFEEYPCVDLGFSMPLKIHARYTREQILVSMQLSTAQTKSSNREGVALNKSYNTEALFINLKKTDEEFSPTTMYDDYAINEVKFHWQSQNQTSPESSKGLSYINQKKENKKILLFIRESKKDSDGNTQGYVFLGPAHFESFYGSKPMSITWQLDNNIPEYLWTESAKMRTG
ncbi:DUF3427 domain-containing protein [Arachidicoccus ginsenosidivorans]